MLNSTITVKIKQRLNKLDSQDYDNIECWQIVEAFNKAQVEWSRRQLHGINLVKEGDEQSTRRKDDLQVLLNKTTITNLTDKGDYSFLSIPGNYLQWKRVDVYAQRDCCDKRRMVIYLAEEGNVSILLRDKLKRPSFEWAETFATLIDDRINVYTNGEFNISEVDLTYYRQPRKIQIQGCVDPYTNEVSTTEVQCEFKDDLVELFIDEAAKIIAGDIESVNQVTIQDNSVENNN